MNIILHIFLVKKRKYDIIKKKLRDYTRRRNREKQMKEVMIKALKKYK